MADLLPSLRDTSSASGASPDVIGIDSDAGEDMLSALSSETARDVLAALHEKPATPSEVADRVDTSLQNVHYHLENLEEADLTEVADTTYSEKGREMSVYAPANRPLVLFSGSDDQKTGLRAALSRILSAVGLLAVLTVVAWGLVRADLLGWFGGGGGASGTPQRGMAASSNPGPSIEFLLAFGLVAVLLAAATAWYVYRRR